MIKLTDILIENLEAFRKSQLAQVKKLGKKARGTAEYAVEEWLDGNTDMDGNDTEKAAKKMVKGVYIIGSVLDPKKFHEDSDTDLAIMIDVPQMDKGTNEEMSNSFQGAYNTTSGPVDVSIWNITKPKGKMVKIG